MSDLHVESSFHKQSMKIDNHLKITEWIDSSIIQSTVIQELEGKRPKLSNLNQKQNRRRYVNFENGSHFICSLNLNNNPELTVFIVFKMTDISSKNQEFVNSLIGNTNRKISAKFITFHKTFGGLGLLISKGYGGAYIAIESYSKHACSQYWNAISNWYSNNVQALTTKMHALQPDQVSQTNSVFV